MLAVGCAATVGLLVINMAVEGQWEAMLAYSGPLAIFLVAIWAVLWTPYVECTPGGVTMVNVLRAVEVPWPAIQSVEGRFGLTLTTAYGTFTSWSASRPKLRDHTLDHELSPYPAVAVEHMWSELKTAGHLDNPRLESECSPRTWRREVITAFAAAATWTILVQVMTRV